MSSVLSHLLRLLIARVGLLLVSGDKRDAEILALRHQVSVLQRQIDRPRFTPTDRTVLALLSRAFGRAGLTPVMLIVKPATVIGWHPSGYFPRRRCSVMAPSSQGVGACAIPGEAHRAVPF